MSELIDFRVRLPLELRPSEDLPDDYLAQYDQVLDLSANRHRTLSQLIGDMDSCGVTHAVVHAEYEHGDEADALNDAVAKARGTTPRAVLRLRHDLHGSPENSAGAGPGTACL